MESETTEDYFEEFQVKSLTEDLSINLGMIGIVILAIILSMLLLPRMNFNGG